MLKYEIPYVYALVVSVTAKRPVHNPSPQIVETICKASKEPLVESKRFKKYFAEYERTQMYCRKGRSITPEARVKGRQIANKHLWNYIEKHKSLLHTIVTSNLNFSKF